MKVHSLPASPAKRGEQLTVNRSSIKPSHRPTVPPSNWRRKRPGVTLVELLIYMALVAIFLITLTDIFASILNVRTESEATSSVDEDSRFILARLNYDINRAQSITTPASLGNSTPNLVIVISGINYTYSLNTNNLELINNLGTNNLNSSETQVSGLSFQKIGNAGGKDTVKIQFTITSKTQRPAGPETKTFNTTVGRR